MIPLLATVSKEDSQSLWTPAEITTALWLDASDASTVTESAGLVSQWRDKSGNARHADQSNNAYKPNFGGHTQNSLNVIFFDGTGEKMATTGYKFSTANTDVRQVFTALKKLSATSGNILSNRVDASPNFYGFSFRSSTATQLSYFHTAQTPTLTKTAPSGFFLAEFVRDGLLVSLGVNDVIDAAQAISGYDGTGVSDLSIGARSDSATPISADIGEIIICHAILSTTDRQKVEGYLAHKWGFAAQLDAGHPYKDSAPTV